MMTTDPNGSPTHAVVVPDAPQDRVTGEAILNATGLPGLPRTRWAWVTGTLFGIGLIKPGPGTYGSVAAVAVWWAVAHSVAFSVLPWVTAGMALAATLIGIPAATRVARESGRKDPQMVVIDEVAGQWLALIFAVPTVPYTLLALLLFRVFDILKPPPVHQLEQLPAGIGIVADDLAAGLYALLLGTFVLQPLLIGFASHATHR